MTATVALTGLRPHIIHLTAQVASGFDSLLIVGVPDHDALSTRDRVRDAISATGYDLTGTVTVTGLAAASPLWSRGHELAAAVAILHATGHVPHPTGPTAYLSGLEPSGRTHPITGIYPAVVALAEAGIGRVVVAAENAAEARLVPGIEVQAIPHLLDLTGPLGPLQTTTMTRRPARDTMGADIHPHALRATLAAAVGGHHMMLIGDLPSLANAVSLMPRLLPLMDEATAREATAIASMAALNPQALIDTPPLVAPAHTMSAAAILGGGSRWGAPGQISLAHGGVLHLPQAPEFAASVLQALRQPIDVGRITLHRANAAFTYPARFQLAMTSAPCPCGKPATCSCSPLTRRRYLSRVNGPLMDHVTIQERTTGTTTEHIGNLAELARRAKRARATARRLLHDTARTFDTVPQEWLAINTPQAVRDAISERPDAASMTARRALNIERLAWTVAVLDGRIGPKPEDVAPDAIARMQL